MLIVHPANRELLRSALAGILALVLLSLPLAMTAESRFDLSPWYVAKALAVLVVGAALILQGLPAHHPFRSIGAANFATAARGVLVALLAAVIGERVSNAAQYVVLAVGMIAATLDGVDGWLARRSNTASRFGARFDMETDALLILTLAVLAWQFEKADAWVILSGVLRYAFVLASLALSWMATPLFPSFRRKTVAVLQTVALLLVLAPFVPRAASAPIAGVALFALALSFLVDVLWLKREGARSTSSQRA
jgi:phosphatidylglycerophosphate synthase